MSEQEYSDIVSECAETRVDLDTVLHPTFNGLKKAFSILFEDFGYTKSDFKRLSDSVYYQGGYPSLTSPAKEVALADQVSKLLRLQKIAGRTTLIKYFEDRGVKIEFVDDFVPESFLSSFSNDDDKDFTEALQSAGIPTSDIVDSRSKMLKVLLDRAQNLQKEICQTADTIKVDAAEEVETRFKIKRPHFVKAVNLAAVKMRRGEGPMLEKIENLHDSQDNLNQALEPLEKN
jgi:hypothetical protein